MAWTLLLFQLLTLCIGSMAAYVVTQPPSVSMSLGERVSLSCDGDGIGNNYVSWYRQKPGHAILPLIYRDTKRPGGIPERFSGSNSGNTATLSISGLQAEDEADYHCFTSGSNGVVFGPGTKLTVTGQPKASPMVMAYGPSQDELRTPTATLTCLISGFYPRSLDVTWTKNGSPVSSGVLTSRPVRQTDNKYSASSYLSVNPNQWRGNDVYICKVTHEGQVIQKELSASQCT
nr:Ig lambda light chain [Monodelphis domestica]